MSAQRADEQEREAWHAARARHGRGRHAPEFDLSRYFAAYGPYEHGVVIIDDVDVGDMFKEAP